MHNEGEGAGQGSDSAVFSFATFSNGIIIINNRPDLAIYKDIIIQKKKEEGTGANRKSMKLSFVKWLKNI